MTAQSTVQTLAGLVGWAGTGIRAVAWDELEASVGAVFPRDYKEFVASFPPGEFQTFLTVVQPGPDDPPGELRRKIEGIAAVVSRRSAGSTKLMRPFYPAADGLLPWAYVGFDYLLCWDRSGGSADSWPTVVVSTTSDEWATFPGTMSELLVDLVSGARQLSMLAYIAEEVTEPRFDPLKPPPEPKPANPQADYWTVHNRLINVLDGPTDSVETIAELVGETLSRHGMVDWAVIEARLGYRLPSDYKRLVDNVRARNFHGIALASPDRHDELALFAFQEATRQVFLANRRTDGEPAPPIYPEPGGPIYWAAAPAGWFCAWLPGTHPVDRSPVLLVHPTGQGVIEPLSMSTFLVRYLSQRKKLWAPWDL